MYHKIRRQNHNDLFLFNQPNTWLFPYVYLVSLNL